MSALRLKGRGVNGETKTTTGLKTGSSGQLSPSVPKARVEFGSGNLVRIFLRLSLRDNVKATLTNFLGMAQDSPVMAIVKSESMAHDRTDPHRLYGQSEEHIESNSKSLEAFFPGSSTERELKNCHRIRRCLGLPHQLSPATCIE